MEATDPRTANYTVPGQRERDINELAGLIAGIAIDGKVNADEAEALRRWCDARRPWFGGALHREARGRILQAISDGTLDVEERADLLHMCERFKSPSPYFAVATADMQRLHGIIGGIAADGVVASEELAGLREWLEGAENLRGSWPYDELDALLTSILKDGHAAEDERQFLLSFMNDFLNSTRDLVLEDLGAEELIRGGVCASQPDVVFPGRMFCITGSSPRASRRELEEVVTTLGGRVHPRVVMKLDYLVVAAERTQSWAFSCYGRKVEAAMTFRREGATIVIVHENDFWDAAEDHGAKRPRRKPND